MTKPSRFAFLPTRVAGLAMAILAMILFAQCSSIGGNAVDFPSIPQLPNVEYAYRFRAQDTLEISVSSDPDSLQKVIIGDDGKFDLRYVGEVAAEGSTREELREIIRQRLVEKKIYQSPQVVVNIIDSGNPPNVVVMGAVARPQVVRYHKNLHVLEAITNAGGLTEAVGLARPVIIVRNAMVQPEVYRFDIEGAVEKRGIVPRLFPGDVVIAQGSALGDFERWTIVARDAATAYANAVNGTDVSTRFGGN